MAAVYRWGVQDTFYLLMLRVISQPTPKRAYGDRIHSCSLDTGVGYEQTTLCDSRSCSYLQFLGITKFAFYGKSLFVWKQMTLPGLYFISLQPCDNIHSHFDQFDQFSFINRTLVNVALPSYCYIVIENIHVFWQRYFLLADKCVCQPCFVFLFTTPWSHFITFLAWTLSASLNFMWQLSYPFSWLHSDHIPSHFDMKIVLPAAHAHGNCLSAVYPVCLFHCSVFIYLIHIFGW